MTTPWSTSPPSSTISCARISGPDPGPPRDQRDFERHHRRASDHRLHSDQAKENRVASAIHDRRMHHGADVSRLLRPESLPAARHRDAVHGHRSDSADLLHDSDLAHDPRDHDRPAGDHHIAQRPEDARDAASPHREMDVSSVDVCVGHRRPGVFFPLPVVPLELIIDAYEGPYREAFLHLLRTTPEPYSRSQFVPGHITASCFIIDRAGRLLLHHHRRLNRWLQMGGHLEPGEDPAEAALREGAEESGLHDLSLIADEIAD